MLPLSAKQVFQYKLLRFIYLSASVSCVSAALYFCKSTSIEYKIVGLVGTISSLCFLYVFRSILFPPDLKTGFTTVLGLFVNYGIAVYLVPNGWMFGFFYLFYSIICFQGIVVLIYICLIVLKRQHNLPQFLSTNVFTQNKLLLVSIIIFFTVPVVLTLFYFTNLFIETVQTAPADQRFWIWIGFFLDIAQQGFIVTRIIMATGYNREINKKQFSLMSNWDWAMNLVFLLAVAGIAVRMFYTY